MFLGMELIAKRSFPIAADNFFRSMLILNNCLLAESKVMSIFPAQKIVNINESIAGPGKNVKIMNIKYAASDSVHLLIINDVFFDQSELRNYLNLRLYNQDKQSMDFPLKRVEWLGRGCFSVNISIPVKEFYELTNAKV
ncbi:hypothetical protein [Dethiobacter alkaliphilus]|uniref:hypothetical protein n=1 Tax=Dethiobacter alkaliphilus TaxID=427926 RepID=UPI002227BAF5|nr:hypothetical protein [Dethiobacter alkaliphilus]MCW3489785.1 hypothetical protein [Dethiobacter alkaliphilus]